MFATYLFHNLGINWGITILACFATLLIPIPIWFLLSGEEIRQRSNFAPTVEKIVEDEEVDDGEDYDGGRRQGGIDLMERNVRGDGGWKGVWDTFGGGRRVRLGGGCIQGRI